MKATSDKREKTGQLKKRSAFKDEEVEDACKKLKRMSSAYFFVSKTLLERITRINFILGHMHAGAMRAIREEREKRDGRA